MAGDISNVTGGTVALADRLDALFNPKHVAVIGASRSPGKHGNRVVGNIATFGYEGRVSLVNPAGGEVDGTPCFTSILDVPERVDCAILVIPAEHAVKAVKDCAEAGTRAIVIAAVGFAEMGTAAGEQRQRDILDIVRSHGMALLGPNTNGLFNGSARLSLGTNTSHGELIDAGPISVVSHSGALFNHFARRLRDFGAGLCKFVPVGNEADLTMLDILEYLIADPTTQVIGMIVEGITDGARFRSLALKARAAGKPIVAFKLGRSTIGAESSLAHSSRLAGEARAYDAMFRHCGVASVPTIEALAGGCAILAGRPRHGLSGDQRLLCIANSGAGAALLADFAENYGIPLASDDHGGWEAPVRSLVAAVPTRAAIRHPIDTGNLGNVRLLERVLDALSDGGVTGPTLVFSHTILTPGRAEADAQVIIGRRRRHGSPTMVLTPGGLGPAIEQLYTRNGVPVFRDTTTLFDSLKCHYETLPDAESSTGDDGDELSAAQVRAVDGILHAPAGRERSRILSEIESGDLLRAAGVPVIESHPVRTGSEAHETARTLGYPVVLKALAPDVAHKNKLGFVVANIADPAALEREFAQLQERAVAQGFALADVPVVLQAMMPSKAELILGVTRDPSLGHFLVLGLGGIYTEVLDLSITIPIPTDAKRMRAWIEASRLGKLIAAIGEGGDLMDRVIGVLCALQSLIRTRGDAIDAIDVNPLLIGREGCIAVDALVVTRATGTA